MQRIITNLLRKFPIENIENAFIQSFIEDKGLKVINNLLILKITEDNSKITTNIKKQIKSPQNIYELVNIFELLIPEQDKKLNGAFYTPKFITEYISDELLKNDKVLICDPSCGCGAFLISAIEKMQKFNNKSVISIIEENIYGADIMEYSIRHCKIILSLLALQYGIDKKTIKFNLFNINSLSNNIYNVFKNVMNNGGFDIILGNPPYIKYQDLSIDLRKELTTQWKTIKTGNYNLYFAFFELGMNLLKNNGFLSYIVPNSYFTSLAGINLRAYLQTNYYLSKIVDFAHFKIFKAQTYTCITFLNKNKNENFKYEKIKEKKQLENLKEISFSYNKTSELNFNKWRLLKEEDSINIKKIENMPFKLKDIVDIRVGIATCKDIIYFIDGKKEEDNFYLKEYNNEIYKIEKNITKKINKISDLTEQTYVTNNKRRIIFPYEIINNKAYIIREQVLKNVYPECYKYLLTVKQDLLNRDKGNSKYTEWYAYARTQGLCYKGEKLLTPTFSENPRFLYEKNQTSLFCNGYGLFLKKDYNQNILFNTNLTLAILQKILNSEIMNYYIKTTSVIIDGGYPCYQKNFIETFGIPNFTNDELIFLDKIKEKKVIDEFLIKKYYLNIQ